MRWFGSSWGAAVCDPETRTATPVGTACVHCEEPISLGDRGVVTRAVGPGGEGRELPWHIECHLRSVTGSLAHQEGRCSCTGGSDELPVGMSIRQEARAAVERALGGRALWNPASDPAD